MEGQEIIHMIREFDKKIRVEERHFNFWEHHRNSWRDIFDAMKSALHSDKSSVAFVNCLDWTVQFGEIEGLFMGMLHNVPKHPVGVSEKYERNDDLERFLSSEKWRRYEPSCCGLYVLSDYSKDYLQNHTDVPVEMLWHPCSPADISWEFRDRVVYVGHWMRKYGTFLNMKTDYEKIVLNCSDDPSEFHKEISKFDHDAVVMNYLDDGAFDKMISESVVFVELYDASACNTVMDCIVRSVPLLINPLPAVVQYLGDGYPFYYSSQEEAENKLGSRDLIEQTREYLLMLDKAKFSVANFIRSLAMSSNYKILMSSPR